MNFFCSVEHVEGWIPGAPRAGRTLTVDEAAQAGRRLWSALRAAP